MFSRVLPIAVFILAVLWPVHASAIGVADALKQTKTLAVDADRARLLEGFEFERGDVTYAFDSGYLYPVVDLRGQEVGAIFLGDGTLSYKPTHPFRQLRLYRWTWFKYELVKGFSQAFVLYTGDNPLPDGVWGEAGPDAEEAAAVLESRWQIHDRWSTLPDNRDIWAHKRGPNLGLDLAQDKVEPIDGHGVRFLEVNARPSRLSVERAAPVWATSSNWWMAWYESPRGIQPIARINRYGTLFTHGDTRAGYQSEVFYSLDPEGIDDAAADVVRAEHGVTGSFDPRMERLSVNQTIKVTLDVEGQVARLFMVPREPRTFGTGRNYLEGYFRVTKANVPGGQPLELAQAGGEILVELPADFAGELELKVEADVAMASGARAESGLFALHSPVGTNFDRVEHALKMGQFTGDNNLVVVVNEAEATVAGGVSGSIEPPAIAVGKYTALELDGGDVAPVMSYAYQTQIHGRFSGTELATLMGGDAALVMGFLTQALGPLPSPSLSVVQTERRPAGTSFDPAAPGVNTFLTEALLAGSAGLDAMSLSTASSAAALDSRNATGGDMGPGISSQYAALQSTAIVAQGVAKQWFGLVVPLVDDTADYWMFEGLRVFLANWAAEILKAGHPSLDQYLDTWGVWAKRADQPGRRLLLGNDNGWLVYNRGAEAKGYLLFNNLRYAVGENNMALGLRATFEALRGEVVTGIDFVNALEGTFGRELDVLFDGVVSESKMEGSLAVAYNLEEVGAGHRLTATAASPEAHGPTLGAALRITFDDLKKGVAFVPLGGNFDVTFPQKVKKVEVLERGSGLVSRVTLTEADIAVE